MARGCERSRSWVICVSAVAALLVLETWTLPRAQHDGTELKPRVAPSATSQRPRVLVTDMMFPNAKAAWRLNSISAMQDHFDADILVINRLDWTFDWKALLTSHRLYDYDLLIFNSKYNHLDWVNKLNRSSAPFAGAEWNRRAHSDATYFLRLRKFANEETFDVSVYDAYYHIFLNMYACFTHSFPDAPPERSWIHLYPGGGFVWHPTSMWNHNVHPRVNLIVTQAFTRDYVLRAMPGNPVLEAFGGPFLTEHAQLLHRAPHERGQNLTVCFTSLGAMEEKGADHYITIAEAYQALYGLDGIEFLGIGNVPSSPAVTALQSMPQVSLDALYASRVDIIFNLDRTHNRHGWPLGSEAVLQGAVLFSTDKHGLNEANKFYFHDGFVRVIEGDVAATVKALRTYALDRALLSRHSFAVQERTAKLFGFGEQMGKIIISMKAAISRSGS